MTYDFNYRFYWKHAEYTLQSDKTMSVAGRISNTYNKLMCLHTHTRTPIKEFVCCVLPIFED